MIDQVTAWREVAAQLGIAIDAPCEIRLADGTRVHASAHIKGFGAENGMIASPDWDRIAHRERLWLLPRRLRIF